MADPTIERVPFPTESLFSGYIAPPAPSDEGVFVPPQPPPNYAAIPTEPMEVEAQRVLRAPEPARLAARDVPPSLTLESAVDLVSGMSRLDGEVVRLEAAELAAVREIVADAIAAGFEQRAKEMRSSYGSQTKGKKSTKAKAAEEV